MSYDNVLAFSNLLLDDQTIIKAIKALDESDVPSLIKIGAAKGYEFTPEDCGAWVNNFQSTRQLSEEELDGVAGGAQVDFKPGQAMSLNFALQTRGLNMNLGK